MTREFLFFHENMTIKNKYQQNQILRRINKKMKRQNWKAPLFWDYQKIVCALILRGVPFLLLLCGFSAVAPRPPPPYIVSNASSPLVVISTWSTKVRLTFQFSRWQVKAKQGQLIFYLLFWCVWSVWENKEFSPKCLLELWVQSTESKK